MPAACKHATDDDPIEGNLNELSFAGKKREWRSPPQTLGLGKRQNVEEREKERARLWMDR